MVRPSQMPWLEQSNSKRCPSLTSSAHKTSSRHPLPPLAAPKTADGGGAAATVARGNQRGGRRRRRLAAASGQQAQAPAEWRAALSTLLQAHRGAKHQSQQAARGDCEFGQPPVALAFNDELWHCVDCSDLSEGAPSVVAATLHQGTWRRRGGGRAQHGPGSHPVP